ncbi:MAG TPA: hypothetical protein VF453_06475 [Burkholderiaceae bacterium]
MTALAGKAGGDTYNVNGGALTIDCDTRYGPNLSPTTGPLGPITISATLGGQVKIDGTKVRLIPYTSGSGNVPAAGTSITQGGVSAELLGVWSAINTTPTTAGSAMPASGFIKVRNVTGGSFAAGALSGITATARGADIVGWIEVAGKEASAFSMGKLGSFTIQGAWLSPFDSTGAEIKTSGVAGQQIQLPASVTGTYYNGVWIETSAGSGVYQRYGNGADSTNAGWSTDERQRNVWISSAGVLTIGKDGGGNVGGVLPASGCRIRVPNVCLVTTNTTVGLGANSTPSSTVNTRYFMPASNSGTLQFDLANFAWGMNAAPYASISVTDSTIVGPFQIVNPLSAPTFQNNIVGQRDTSQADVTQCVVTTFNGGTVSDNTFSSIAIQTSFVYAGNLTMNGGGYMDRNRFQVMVPRTVSGSNPGCAAINLSSMTSADSNDFVGEMIYTLTLTDTKLSNSRFAARSNGTLGATVLSGQAFWNSGSGFTNATIDGWTYIVNTANACAPSNNGIVVPSGSSGFKVRNFGTAAQPLSLGTVNPMSGAVIATLNNAYDLGVFVQNCWFADGNSSSASVTQLVSQATFNIEGGSIPGVAAILSASNAKFRGVRVTNAPRAAANTSGIHWADYFTSDTVGAIAILMTDVVSLTSDQLSYSGTAQFSNAPGLIMPSVGDQVVWTMNYAAQGHSQLQSISMSGGTIGNYTVEFRADIGDGNGWSAWQAATNTNLQAVAITPSKGIKLAVRLTATTGTTTAITGLTIATTTTLANQQAVSYPLDPVTVTVTNCVVGSRIKITRTDTNAVLVNDAVTASTYSVTGDWLNVPMQIELRCATAPGPYYQPFVAQGTPTINGLSITALQVRDDQ